MTTTPETSREQLDSIVRSLADVTRDALAKLDALLAAPAPAAVIDPHRPVEGVDHSTLNTPGGKRVELLNCCENPTDPACVARWNGRTAFIEPTGTLRDVDEHDYFDADNMDDWMPNEWPVPAGGGAALDGYFDSLAPVEQGGARVMTAIEEYDRWCKWVEARFAALGEAYADEWNALEGLPGAVMPALYAVVCDAADSGRRPWLPASPAPATPAGDKPQA